MKLNKFFMGILGALALTACSNEDVPDKPVIDTNESRFMAVTIRNAQAGDLGRAGEEDFESGKDYENNVTSLCFYFFDENGDPFNVASNSNRVVVAEEDITTPDNTAVDYNIEKILNAVIVLNAATAGDFQKLNSMVAITNFDLIKEGALKGNMSLDDLNKVAGDYAYWETAKAYNENDKNENTRFVMTNTVYVDNDGNTQCEKPITMADLQTTRELAIQHPVEIYVERTVAKIRVSTAWDNGMEIAQGTKFNGGVYNAIRIKDADGNDIKLDDGTQIYVILTGWNPTNVTDKTRLFKSVSPEWNNTLTDWEWTDNKHRRSYWALNADNVNFQYFRDNQATGTIGVGTAGTVFYVNENAADNQDGTKSTYTPSQQLSNRTEVYIAGILVTIDGEGQATPVSLAKWGGKNFTEEGIVTEMLNAVSGQIYYCSSAESSDTHSEANYKSIDKDFVKLIEGIYVEGKATDKAQEGQRYLSYIQLMDQLPNKAIDGKLYTRNPEYDETDENSKKFVELIPTKANEILAGMPGARIWGNGNTYYYHDITHLGLENTKGLYGVVRNHIYDIKLTKLTGLGTPILKPDSDSENEDKIIPEKPTPDEFFLAARINILSWRIVNNKVTLDW